MVRKLFLCFALAGALVGVAPAASAQPSPPPVARPQTPRERARERYEAAQAVYRSAPLQAALLYLEAYAIVPRCALLFNAGNAFELGGQIEQALEQYRRYHDTAIGDTCTTAERADAAAAQDHILRIERILRNRALRAQPRPLVPPIQPPPSRTLPPLRYREERASARVLHYLLWGVGGAGVAFSIYSFAMMSDNRSDANNPASADPGRSGRAADDALIGGALSLTVGVLAAGAGTYLYLAQPRLRFPIPAVVSDGRSVMVTAAASF